MNTRNIRLLIASLLLVSACNSNWEAVEETNETDTIGNQLDPLLSPKAKVLVLWVTDTAGGDLRENGNIPPKMTISDFPEISVVIVADRLTRCGETRYVVDLASSHVGYVFVPSTPNNLKLVKCVQGLMNFSFSAGVGTAGNLGVADQTPFEALYA